VKSTVDVKPEHQWDLALQYYVLTGAGVPIRYARVMHLNRDYVYLGGEYDLKHLFKFRNLTHLVKRRRPEVLTALGQMRKLLRAESPPAIAVGPQCAAPYRCQFYGHCHQNQSDDSINRLPRLGPELREQLAAMGVTQIAQIPDDFAGLSALQTRVIEAVRTQTRFHDLAISQRLRELDFPIHFVDFETFAPALPVYLGTRPYQVIPFEWSDHILKDDGNVEHRDFLHDQSSDPRRAFTEKLLKTIGTRGSILVYSSFEDARLGELSETFKDLASELERVRKRIVDLLPLIREHVYDPGFHGSFSLKSVLPALVPDLGYDDLAISDGGLASLAYAEMQAPETSVERRVEIRRDLLAYCRRDTLALLGLYRLLR
jgi:predicted RecB family nuclease